MIPEAGDRSEFKAVMLKECSLWPLKGEVFMMHKMVHLARLPSYEFIVMMGLQYERRTAQINGRTVALPLAPRAGFEFMRISPVGNSGFYVDDGGMSMFTISLSEWKSKDASLIIKFMGYADFEEGVDDRGNWQQIRLQGIGA